MHGYILFLLHTTYVPVIMAVLSSPVHCNSLCTISIICVQISFPFYPPHFYDGHCSCAIHCCERFLVLFNVSYWMSRDHQEYWKYLDKNVQIFSFGNPLPKRLGDC